MDSTDSILSTLVNILEDEVGLKAESRGLWGKKAQLSNEPGLP